MEAVRYAQAAKEDAQIYTLLEEAAERASRQVAVEEPRQYTTGAEPVLLSIAAFALYRWAKDTLDHRRARSEVEILQQQERVVATMIHEDGFPPKEAHAAVSALLQGIKERSGDDSLIQKILALVGKGA